MSVLEFRGGRCCETVLTRLAHECPEIVDAARWFLERARDQGVSLTLTDAGLERLDALLRQLARDKPEASSTNDGSGLARCAGALFGCFVVERVGGEWRQDNGSWSVADIGPRSFSYDPFEATHLLLSGGDTSLVSEVEDLREDARGKGPRSRFEDLFEESHQRLMGHEPVDHKRGFCYRTCSDEWIFLDNLYRRAGGDPERWPEEMDNFVRKLEGAWIEKQWLERDGTRRLFPTLKPSAEAGDHLLRIPVAEDLTLVFVLDLLRSMSFVTSEQAQRWKLTAPDLRRLAFENLAKRNFGLQVNRARGAITVHENDGYDAVRALLPGFAERAEQVLGTSVCAVLPHRDLLVVFDPRQPTAPCLETELAALYRTKAYPLTPRVFRLSGEGLALTAAR